MSNFCWFDLEKYAVYALGHLSVPLRTLQKDLYKLPVG